MLKPWQLPKPLAKPRHERLVKQQTSDIEDRHVLTAVTCNHVALAQHDTLLERRIRTCHRRLAHGVPARGQFDADCSLYRPFERRLHDSAARATPEIVKHIVSSWPQFWLELAHAAYRQFAVGLIAARIVNSLLVFEWNEIAIVEAGVEVVERFQC